MDGDNFTAASVLAKLLTASFVDGKMMRMWVYMEIYVGYWPPKKLYHSAFEPFKIPWCIDCYRGLYYLVYWGL